MELQSPGKKKAGLAQLGQVGKGKMSTEYVGRYEAADENGNVWEIDYWRETIEARTRGGTAHLPGMKTLKTVIGDLSVMPDPDDKRKLVIPQLRKTLSLPDGFEAPW